MKRNKFSLSHTRLLTCKMGELVPCGLTEVLPGDTVQQATSLLVRVSPLQAPVMHPVRVRVHHWFVPHRLVWDDWEDFITGGEDGLDASEFPTKTLTAGINDVGSLADYLGCPTDVDNLVVSALPFRVYALIFNEWYRDQDLVSKIALSTTGGSGDSTNSTLQNAAWEKDYFTSARPWTQKGPEVTIPLSADEAPVKQEGAGNPQDFASMSATAANVMHAGAGAAAGYDLFTDLTSVTASSITDLRLAFALQRYEEARARYGSRYTEYLAYLGVRSSDARLQRPEYLGGGKQVLQFSEVLQTAEGVNPVGELRGHGIGAVRSNRYRRFFEEHGYILSLMSVLPKTMYVQGLARTWNRRAKEDFWQKELEHIGQQEVLNKELYAAHATPEGTFGYQDRYDEYRRSESGVSGDFRGSTLDHWHMARIFASDPTLNASFVQSSPTSRIYADESSDHLWVMANHSIQARRALSKRGGAHIF